ncbi:NAD(P)-binding protein [Mytilinidion resinicola]|uniref:NAD(P)-binding protein n=1 Tax=Mytilinidion resinicola TaxID=574789 RepID=A0A6A6YVT5_9PEZI|nr:NAD(P)-binding protein [Mytilinidion resinicola]KAF2812095.1 NAD(P)-binding protein [Mytilinidion resinicola]
MSTIVAVAGGSSGLGRTIVDALKADARYEVLILGRKLEEESGTRVLAIDYTSVDALVALLEANKVAVVISTVNSLVDTTPEFNLIKAAAQSHVTKRFIPNVWSALEFKPEPRFTSLPIAVARLQAIDELKKTNLEWTAIYPRIFMESFVQGMPWYLTVYPLKVDIENSTAGLPVKGEGLISLTYSRDIAKYVASLLGLEKWEQSYFITADVKTWNEIVAAAEAGKGVKFNVSYDSIEKLQKGEATELPSYTKIYEAFGGREIAKPIVQAIFAQYGLWMDEGLFNYKGGTFLNDLFPEIKPLKLDEAWEKAGGKA